MRENEWKPEGLGVRLEPGQPLSRLRELMAEGAILEGTVTRCDGQRNLHVQLGEYEALVPREEAVHPKISGSERDIALLSRVGKRICFTVESVDFSREGRPRISLSRRKAQQIALDRLMATAVPGQVLPARVTHLAPFGAFVDLGCGIISMIPLEYLSFSRVSHPSQRLGVGQDILVLVKDVDTDLGRVYLSHRELLGTWAENAEDFPPGESVTGIVRSVQDYGVFIELTPNLCGLADRKPDVDTGDLVSVYVRSQRPHERRVKLQIIERLGRQEGCPPLRYFIRDGLVDNWTY